MNCSWVTEKYLYSICNLTDLYSIKYSISCIHRSRNSTISIVTGYGLSTKELKFKSQKSQEFPLLKVVQIDFGACQHPTQWVSVALSLGVKRPGCEAEQSPPSSAEDKNTWVYISTPHMASWLSAHISQAQGQYLLYP